VIIAHGSKEPRANEAFQEFLEKFRKAYSGRQVFGAFLELSKPGIPEAIEQAAGSGAREIFIIPLMLFPGRHVRQDIPAFIEDAKMKHPEIDFHYGGPLADHPAMLDLLDRKAQAMKGKSS